ncbi:MAG: histidine phosphatase family protein [Phormidesmis sp.]
MKKLHLIRHAKSSWRDRAIADIDRPLNQRGLKSCSVMAGQIVKAGCHFEQVFCSPAVRAQTTIEQIAKQLSEKSIEWRIDSALYTFEYEALLNWCQALDESLPEAVVVGHNNAITDFVNWVGDYTIENVPTCGYVQLAFDTTSWRELSADSAEVLSFLKPKMFM